MAPRHQPDQRQWRTYKRIIRYLYLVENLSLSDLVASLKSRGFQTNKSQVEYQLRRWKFHKYIDGNGIAYLRDRIAGRDQAGLETNVFLSAIPIPPTQWRRRIRRQFVSTVQRLNPEPRPETPQNLDLFISTPAPLPLQFSSWPLSLPWLQSQPSISAIASATASIVPERSMSAGTDLIASALFASSGSKALTSSLQSSRNLSVAAAFIGKTMPESFEGENFIRANVLLSGETDHEAVTEAIKVMLFRLSNNLGDLNDAPILDLFHADVILSRIPHGSVISMEDPTIAAITDKLFQRALSQGDKGLDTAKALLHLPVDVNRPITVNGVYQMPLQAAVGKGALELTKLLIDGSADINTTFGKQRPLLVRSAEHKERQLALQLSDMLISTHKLAEKNMQLNSALLTAASRCNIELVKLLIRQGASADHCAYADAKALFSETTVLVQALYTPIRISRSSWGSFPERPDDTLDTHERRLELAKYLLKPGREDGELPSRVHAARVTPDALLAACASGNAAAIEFLHNHGANINTCNTKGLSPLRAAVFSRDPQILALIYRLGAKLDELTTISLGNRPSLLYVAISTHTAWHECEPRYQPVECRRLD